MRGPFLDCFDLMGFSVRTHRGGSVTVRPCLVRTAGPTANIAGVPVIVE